VRVRLLGTAAGGGFPQWNCACPNCDGLRRGTIRARPRREFCAAVSGNDRDWYLINAPPDVHAQIASFPPLAPSGKVRATSIAGVLLTGADLDSVLGLAVLREGPALTVYATRGVQRALDIGGLAPSRLLANYAPPNWLEPATERSLLPSIGGRTSGLDYRAFEVDSHEPRYLQPRDSSLQEVVGDRIGYEIWDAGSGKRLVVLPGVLTLAPGGETPGANHRERIGGCDLLLLDGTCWSETELSQTAPGGRTAAQMGHLRVGHPGSLEQIKELNVGRTIYVHINNTNPMLNEDSAEYRAVYAAGAEVGYDGLEIEL
jgi:pyrroloquinoline quinone biosynthesis protein B